jgi:hypothetical protein
LCWIQPDTAAISIYHTIHTESACHQIDILVHLAVLRENGVAAET